MLTDSKNTILFQVTSGIVDFVVEGNLAFNTAQLPSLKKLLEDVTGRQVMMPTRDKFMSTLDKKFKDMKSSLKSILKKQKYLCITCDAWSSRAQAYLGVTVHFINEDFNRESFLLAFKQMIRRQTYDYLAEVLHEILKDYEIDVEKVTNVVTDGGSAFCKMFCEFGVNIDSSTHDTADDFSDDEDVDNGEINPDSEVEAAEQFMQSETGELFQSSIIDFSQIQASSSEVDDYFGGSSSHQEPRHKLPSQRRCYSHHLNLVPKDFAKRLPVNAERVFTQTYNKLNSLWNTTNRSCRGKTICKEILGCVLKTPCDTRWNSKFDSIKKIFEIIKIGNIESNKVNILIKRLRLELKSANHLQTLSAADVNILAMYIAIMQPVAVALDTLQGEYNCSQGFILPVLFSMKHHINEVPVTCDFDGDFKSTMLKVQFGKLYALDYSL